MSASACVSVNWPPIRGPILEQICGFRDAQLQKNWLECMTSTPGQSTTGHVSFTPRSAVHARRASITEKRDAERDKIFRPGGWSKILAGNSTRMKYPHEASLASHPSLAQRRRVTPPLKSTTALLPISSSSAPSRFAGDGDRRGGPGEQRQPAAHQVRQRRLRRPASLRALPVCRSTPPFHSRAGDSSDWLSAAVLAPWLFTGNRRIWDAIARRERWPARSGLTHLTIAGGGARFC